MKTMFGSSLLPFVCTRALVLFMLFVFVCVHSGTQHVSTLWLTWRVSCKRKELLTLREHLGSPPVFGGVRIAHLICLLCSVASLFVFVMCLVCPMLPVSLVCLFLIALRFSLTFIYFGRIFVWPFGHLLKQYILFSMFKDMLHQNSSNFTFQ